jgi:hypothetical protein
MTQDRPLNMRALTGDNELCQQQSGALTSALGHGGDLVRERSYGGPFTPAPSERFLAFRSAYSVHLDASLAPLADIRERGEGAGF